jgi:hypothetical protein
MKSQEDIKRDLVSLDNLVRKEIIFDVIEEKESDFDVENYCDMTLTTGMPLISKEVKNV